MAQIDDLLLKEEANIARTMKAWNFLFWFSVGVIILLVLLAFIFIDFFLVAFFVSVLIELIFSRIMYNKAKKKSDCILMYKRFNDILRVRHSIHIHELAYLVRQSVSAIHHNLGEMIRLGYICSVRSNCHYERFEYVYNADSGMLFRPQKPLVSVTCSACGGVTQLPAGTRGICDYCDSQIQS